MNDKSNQLAQSIRPFVASKPTSHTDEIIESHQKGIQHCFDELIDVIRLLVSISPEPQNGYQRKSYDKAVSTIAKYR